MQKEEFEHLFNSYAKSVRAFIWRRSNGLDVGVSSVDDIEADVWTIAWARKESAPTDAELELAWLFQISRHVLANHIRKSVTRRKISNTFHPDEITALAADSLVLLNEEIKEVFEVLNASEREVMALSVWESMKPAQIALVLGLTPNAVSIRLNKARKKISDYLERNQ
ncbi:MAG: sigma-70 family RNA polymerase sigma factor [Actinobacteria bacterium]|jgi:RNA polymerase sigma-70 factor (ECF subfamily)|nr:sigma-70 family RNA polymerase sigma factor [Actinomycetota bacterium]